MYILKLPLLPWRPWWASFLSHYLSLLFNTLIAKPNCIWFYCTLSSQNTSWMDPYLKQREKKLILIIIAFLRLKMQKEFQKMQMYASFFPRKISNFNKITCSSWLPTLAIIYIESNYKLNKNWWWNSVHTHPSFAKLSVCEVGHHRNDFR